MKIIIITQDEPFYLANSLRYLLEILPKHSSVIGCVVNDVSPFGKKESFLKKTIKTYNIFGLRFFMHYSIKFALAKFKNNGKINNTLKRNIIPEIILDEHINHPVSIGIIKEYKADLLVSILGNQIFKKDIINLAPQGCINLHTALLPKYRGLMPTFWVMKNDEKYTGVSVFFIDEGIDSGPIIVQKKIEIKNRTQEELIKYTKKIGMESIAEAVDLIEKKQVNLIDNNNIDGSYYSFPEREDVIDFLSKEKRFF